MFLIHFNSNFEPIMLVANFLEILILINVIKTYLENVWLYMFGYICGCENECFLIFELRSLKFSKYFTFWILFVFERGFTV